MENPRFDARLMLQPVLKPQSHHITQAIQYAPTAKRPPCSFPPDKMTMLHDPLTLLQTTIKVSESLHLSMHAAALIMKEGCRQTVEPAGPSGGEAAGHQPTLTGSPCTSGHPKYAERYVADALALAEQRKCIKNCQACCIEFTCIQLIR